MLDQILGGLIGIAIGLAFVVFARRFVLWFGGSAWAEQKLGSGGTYTLYRILGIFIAAVSFLYMTGFLDDLILKILRGLGIIK